MEGSPQKSFVDRLADAGEDAIQRLSGAPGGDRLVGVVNGLKERLDDMQKRMRALAAIEQRLDAIEKRLDEIEGKTPARSGSTPRKGSTTSSSTKKTTT
jgi:tetrahydromethanopterin S-methyltransferase subunit G